MKYFAVIILVLSSLTWAGSKNSSNTKSEAKMERSEFYYQPEANEHNLKVDYDYAQVENYKSSGYNIDGNAQIARITYLYGMNANHAIGLSQNYGSIQMNVSSATYQDSSKSVGLSDLVLNYQGLSGANDWIVRWKLSLTLSPAHAIYAGFQKDGNRYSGGHSLAPEVAIEKKLDLMHWGFFANYSIFGTRYAESASNSSNTSENTGGNSSNVGTYIEIPREQHLFGTLLSYQSTEKSESISSSGSRSETGTSNSYSILLSYSYEAHAHFSYVLQYLRLQYVSPIASTSNTVLAGIRFGF